MIEYLRKNYQVGLDKWGLALFLAVMLPNFVWFAIPASNDILRNPSVTAGLDAIASGCQVIMAVTLSGVVNKNVPKRRGIRPLSAAVLGSLLCYYIAWTAYYQGIAVPVAVLALAIFPCGAFLLYEMDCKNRIALIPTAIFTICHLISSTINFII